MGRSPPLEQLANALEPGQHGCLREGTYVFDELVLMQPGITLTAYPGERPTLRGRIWVKPEAEGMTMSNLNLDGRSPAFPRSASPTIAAHDVTFRDNDVTNHHTSICFSVGGSGYGRTTGTVIEANRIHDCGRLPATNLDHGIYLVNSEDVLIKDNLIYGNADRGIQLYPNADHTTITGNVIDRNGQAIAFGGIGHRVSSDNTITRNLITNSLIRHNVEGAYEPGAARGQANLVRYNCIAGTATLGYNQPDGSGIQASEAGFSTGSNLAENPEYAAPESGNYSLAARSPCHALGEEVTLSPPSSDGQGAPVITGSLPGVATDSAGTVDVQQRIPGAWKTVLRRRVSESQFRIELGHALDQDGSARIRAKAPGKAPSTPVSIPVAR